MTADTQMTVSCSIGKTSAAGDVSVGNVGLLSSVVQESELFDSIVVAASEVAALSTELQGVSKRLKAGGKLLVENADLNALNGTLLLGGFVDIRSDGANVVCSKPSYAETAVPLKNDKKKIWTMLANDFVDGDVIDEDSLLREEDMTPAAPAVDCGPGDGQVKKRACKNCSCGLKEMEEAEENGEKIKVAQPTGSSCGNCAKGDAFRCASCPYLGTPAFEPGSKPQIKIKEDGSKVLLDLGNEEF